MSGSTVVIGLNGALQKRFVLKDGVSLVPGNVHRAKELQVGVGGKGQDVAISLSCLDYHPGLQLAQFVGSGPEGDTVMKLLEEKLGTEAVTSLTVRPKSGMRTCTTIVAADESTELVEPSGVITDDEIQTFMEKLSSTDKARGAAAMCFMGSMPPGCPTDMYAQIYEKLCSKTSLCLIDSVVGLEPTLTAIARTPERGSVVLKVNASELCRLAGVKKSSSEAGGIALQELVNGVQTFLSKFGDAKTALSGLAITDGRHPAHFITLNDNDNDDNFRILQLSIPDLSGSGVLFPIGAGDSVAAGTLAAWKCLGGTDCMAPEIKDALTNQQGSGVSIMATAFAFGLACGSASCLHEENSVFETKDVLRFFEAMGTPKEVGVFKPAPFIQS